VGCVPASPNKHPGPPPTVRGLRGDLALVNYCLARLRGHRLAPRHPDEERELIFQRFQRAQHRGKAGFGLGLAIGRELPQRMGQVCPIAGAPFIWPVDIPHTGFPRIKTWITQSREAARCSVRAPRPPRLSTHSPPAVPQRSTRIGQAQERAREFLLSSPRERQGLTSTRCAPPGKARGAELARRPLGRRHLRVGAGSKP